ncbi:MAG: hypothetical protein ACRDNI_11485 [Gaiellaceae bacterium]
MEPEQPQRDEEEEPSSNGRRREHSDDERRRRRRWIGDAELARSLNAAIQDEDVDRND